MSSALLAPRWLAAIPIALVGLALAGCQDATGPVTEPAGPVLAASPKNALVVTSLDDPGDGTCTTSHCTLREAIGNATPGTVITFKNGLAGTILLNDGELAINKEITIDGGRRITVDGQSASRVIHVHIGGNLRLRAVTITGGSANVGAGIWNEWGTLIVEDSRIAGNTATASGGGIVSSGPLTIVRTTVADNHAADAAGIRIFGVSPSSIVASTISGNSAEGATGGIWYDGAGNHLLSGTTISGNSADVVGAAWVSLNAGALMIRSSTIAFNSAATAIGGMNVFWNNGVPSNTIANSIVAGNTSPANAAQANDCSGVLISLGYNLTGSPTGQGPCEFTAPGDFTVAPVQVVSEVLDPTLRDNGGPTFTHALVERGRAVDAGYCPGQTTDQRGKPRPWDDSRMANAVDACDIGAFEWQPTSTGGTGGSGSGKGGGKKS